MAKNFGLNVKISADTSGLKKGLNEATDETKKFASANQKAFDRLIANANQGDMGMRDLKKTLREVSRISFDDLDSSQIEAVKARMGELTDQIGDFRSEVNQRSLDPFQKMASSLQSVSTLAQGVTGTMSLFGVESDKANALMQKTVALMGVANAAQEASVLFKEKALGLTLKQIALDIQKNGLATTFNTICAVNPWAIILVSLGTAVGLLSLLCDSSDEYKRNSDLIKSAVVETNTGYKAQSSIIKENTLALIDQLVAEGKISKAEGDRRKANIDLNAELSQSVNAYKALREERDKLGKQIKANEELLKTSNATERKGLNDVLEGQRKRYSELTAGMNAYSTKINTVENKAKTLAANVNAENEKLAQKTTKTNDKAASEVEKTWLSVKDTLVNDFNEDPLVLQAKLDAKVKADKKEFESKVNDLIGSDLNVTGIEQINVEMAMYISPKTFNELDNNISVLQNKLKNTTPEEGIKIKLDIAELENQKEALNEAMKTPFEVAQEQMSRTQEGLNVTSEMFSAMGNVIGGNTGSWLSWGANAIQTISQILPQLMTLIGLNVAEGASKQADKPFPYNLIAVGATVAGVLGIISAIPKNYATGGIVPGISYTGDKVPAMVNSSEMILNTSQQSNLFRMINTGINNNNNDNNNGGVVFEIKGDRLVGVLNKYSKKQKSYR